MTARLVAIDVVEDRTAGARCDEGFLRLRRLTLRNRYEDGTASRAYPCDVLSRRHTDAVAVVLWDEGPGRRVRVALRTGVRPPVALRDAEPRPLLVAEIVAGMLEGDERASPSGIARRAADECREEAGYAVDPSAITALGDALFASPGITDERIHFRSVHADLDARGARSGDGSVMEEAGEVIVLPLDEAIRRCRSGAIPDMKTEVALLRLCDAIGYVPLLDRFVPDPTRGAWLLGDP